MSIVKVTDTGVAGVSEASPGPTVSISASAGQAVTVAGIVFSTSATVELTGITDSAGGNTWQVSTSTAQKPPNQVVHLPGDGGYSVVFVAWCLSLVNPITSVTVADNSGLTDFWRIAVVSWTGIVVDDSGASALFASTTTPGATVNLGNTGDLVIGAANGDNAGTWTGNPTGGGGWTDFTGSGVVRNIGYISPAVTGNYLAQWAQGSPAPAAVAVQAFSPAALPVATAAVAPGLPEDRRKFPKLRMTGII